MMDGLDIFWIIRKVSGYPGEFPESLDILRMVESFRIASKDSELPGYFPDGLESVQVV